MTNEAKSIFNDSIPIPQLEFPSVEEIKAAQKICCGKCCNRCESPAEYAWRKRETDLSDLLEKAINTELSDFEREVIKGVRFESKTISEIAERRGCSKSTVSKTLSRADRKLEKALRYAVMYQENLKNETAVPLFLGRASAILASKKSIGTSSGDRIRLLRQSHCLSRKRLEALLAISERRITALENGADPDCFELLSLSAFFGVTTDYILKGEMNIDENIA